ncbi:MAG: putative maltokinase, partial [Acidimicrobiales bacterium]
AGFSRANPQKLFLPVIIDPGYSAQGINVEAQQENTSSLLWWMKRLISQRNRYHAFARGSLTMLFPDNRKVLAFMRCYGDEKILVVVNLSRFAQAVELDLSEFRGATPVELFGGSQFPAIGDLPYFITLGPHGFYWFSLETSDQNIETTKVHLNAPGSWESVFTGRTLLELEDLLAPYLADKRWFAGKSARIRSVELYEAVPVHDSSATRRGVEPPLGSLAFMGIGLVDGTTSTYVLPVAFASDSRAEDLRKWHPESVICDLAVAQGPEGAPVEGVLFDAVWDPDFMRALLDTVGRRRQLRGHAGRLVGVPTPSLRQFTEGVDPAATPTPMAVEQSNTSILYSNKVVAKLLRRVEPGIYPGVEISRFLGERTDFKASPKAGGHLEYRPDGHGSEPVTVATFEEFVQNEGDGWGYVVDNLAKGLEEIAATIDASDLAQSTGSFNVSRTFDANELLASTGELEEAAGLLIGPHLEWSALLGRSTAELHIALASDRTDPAFAPEPFTSIERRETMHAARITAKRAFATARPLASQSEIVRAVLEREDDVMAKLQGIMRGNAGGSRIRVHGDYHLGQVLWTGKGFEVIDFDGEPLQSLTHRRRKRPALVDVAGMLRSFHYASRAAAIRVGRTLTVNTDGKLDPWLSLWYRGVAGSFISSYMNTIPEDSVILDNRADTGSLLEFLLFEKALYELGYEANNRPDWIDIPARGILDLLGKAS